MKETFLRWKLFPQAIVTIFFVGVWLGYNNFLDIILAVALGGATPLQSHLFLLKMTLSIFMIIFPLQCISWRISLRK